MHTQQLDAAYRSHLAPCRFPTVLTAGFTHSASPGRTLSNAESVWAWKIHSPSISHSTLGHVTKSISHRIHFACESRGRQDWHLLPSMARGAAAFFLTARTFNSESHPRRPETFQISAATKSEKMDASVFDQCFSTCVSWPKSRTWSCFGFTIHAFEKHREMLDIYFFYFAGHVIQFKNSNNLGQVG